MADYVAQLSQMQIRAMRYRAPRRTVKIPESMIECITSHGGFLYVILSKKINENNLPVLYHNKHVAIAEKEHRNV